MLPSVVRVVQVDYDACEVSEDERARLNRQMSKQESVRERAKRQLKEDSTDEMCKTSVDVGRAANTRVSHRARQNLDISKNHQSPFTKIYRHRQESFQARRVFIFWLVLDVRYKFIIFLFAFKVMLVIMNAVH